MTGPQPSNYVALDAVARRMLGMLEAIRDTWATRGESAPSLNQLVFDAEAALKAVEQEGGGK